jgi:hypothetical protein
MEKFISARGGVSLLCLSDGDDMDAIVFEKVKGVFLKYLFSLLPKKSSFER